MTSASVLPPLPKGTPGRPEKPRYRQQHGLIIVCPDEGTQRALYEALRLLAQVSVKVVNT